MAVMCELCHTVMMSDHPELIFWLKCSLCGFCKHNTEKQAKHPNTDKYLKKLDFMKKLPIKRPE